MSYRPALLCTLTAPQVSALREIVDTWDESSGSFLPVPERRPGPKGDPGDRGPPGKEVSDRLTAQWLSLVEGTFLQPWASTLLLPRAPSAFLENVG